MVSTLGHSADQTASAPVAAHAARWLQVVTDLHPRYGGLSSAIPELSRALRGSRIAAPIAALCHREEQYVPWQLDVGDVHFLPRSRRAWLLRGEAHRSLERLFRDCDGIHVHGLWTAASQGASSAARRTGRPFCVSAHGMLEPWSLQQRPIRKRLYAALVEHRVLRGAACLHALTRSEADSYRAITKQVPVAIVPNGVDVPHDISEEHFFAIYPGLRGKRMVLFLSRLHPKKAVDALLGAWPRLSVQHPEAHLVIAGVGEPLYEAKLKTWAEQHCPQQSFTFTGLLQGRLKWAALRSAECFVLPSHSEGFSIAILEALGAGTPVIATEQCNMPELRSARCGWMTEPNSNALQTVLHDVLSNSPAVNQQAGQRGRALVQQRYTWSAVAEQMASVYRWIGGDALPAGVEVLQ